jgi:hypothetical protein
VSVRDRLRLIAFLSPWITIPLALLGVALTLAYPLVLLTPLAWALYPVAVVLAVVFALWLRTRYKLAILDSSPLGVFYWLQKRS